MNGPEHYREAERLLGVASDLPIGAIHDGAAGTTLDQAQVHATLALVAATAERMASRGPGDFDLGWNPIFRDGVREATDA